MDTPDMIENGSTPNDADHPEAQSRIPQWARDLFSTEPLGVAAFSLALLAGMGATTIGPFSLGIPTELVGGSEWWFMLPILIPGGLAFILGLAGLWVLPPEPTARWPHALSGGGALIGIGVVALALIVWATQPDSPSPFEQL